jgi:uncharacterized phiE125 gp8 family phage protein
MWSKLISAPAELAISVDEVKDRLNIEYSEKDEVLEALIKSSTLHAEKITGRALVDQTWDFYFDGFPCDNSELQIPKSPTIELVGVFYRQNGGDEQELASSSYEFDSAREPGRLVPVFSGSWPTIGTFTNSVRVRVRAGYVDLDASPIGSVPEDIKTAITMRVQADFDQGPDADKWRESSDRMLSEKRIHTGIA